MIYSYSSHTSVLYIEEKLFACLQQLNPLSISLLALMLYKILLLDSIANPNVLYSMITRINVRL
jgi:hypothetical protein